MAYAIFFNCLQQNLHQSGPLLLLQILMLWLVTIHSEVSIGPGWNRWQCLLIKETQYATSGCVREVKWPVYFTFQTDTTFTTEKISKCKSAYIPFKGYVLNLEISNEGHWPLQAFSNLCSIFLAFSITV